MLWSTAGKSFLTITSIMINMTTLTTIFIDILKASAMQISMWKWEIKMIAKFGFNWGYDEFRF
jgi:hypothetical protein